MNKICTTIEQSQKLIELGIDVNTADMMWDDWRLIDEGWKLSVGYYHEIKKDYGRKCYPAWSLSALIEILPLGLDIHNISDGHKIYYYVEIYIKEIYMKLKHMCKEEICLSTERHENLVDCCYEMILKLYELNLL